MTALRRRILPAPKAFFKKLLRAAPWLFAFTLIGLWLEHVGILTPLSNAGRDTFGMLRGERAPTDVRIVLIDDAAYRSLFAGRSPLDPAALHRLIAAVEAAHPRVIAVDVITSDPSFRTLVADADWSAPIVWAEDVAPAGAACGEPERCAYRTIPALGGRLRDDGDACDRGRTCAAPPVYGKLGGVTREYRRRTALPGLAGTPSLAWATVAVCAHVPQPLPACVAAYERGKDEDEPQALDVTAPIPWPYTQTASNVLAFAATPGWRRDSELRGRIVIVGGSYGGQDRHRVAGADVDGAWLNAQIVEDELHVPTGELPWFAGPVVDLLLGIALVYLLYRFRIVPALAASAGLVALVLLASFVAFGRLGVWLDVVPILVGVTLHELQEHVPEYLRLAVRDESESA